MRAYAKSHTLLLNSDFKVSRRKGFRRDSPPWAASAVLSVVVAVPESTTVSLGGLAWGQPSLRRQVYMQPGPVGGAAIHGIYWPDKSDSLLRLSEAFYKLNGARG